jgi:hypothetical protein
MTALVVAWLPYVVFRCVPVAGAAHAACYMLGQRDESRARNVGGHHHDHPGQHREGSASTCCDLTGKSNVTLPAAFAADPPPLTALAASPSNRVAPPAVALDGPGRLSRAHAPPAYLGNSALRL